MQSYGDQDKSLRGPRSPHRYNLPQGGGGAESGKNRFGGGFLMAETLLAFAPGAFTHGAPDMATVPSRGAMYLDLPTRGDKHARQRERARRALQRREHINA